MWIALIWAVVALVAIFFAGVMMCRYCQAWEYDVDAKERMHKRECDSLFREIESYSVACPEHDYPEYDGFSGPIEIHCCFSSYVGKPCNCADDDPDGSPEPPDPLEDDTDLEPTHLYNPNSEFQVR